MLKEFAWETFEKTGNIDSYMFYKEIDQKKKAFKESKVAEEEAATSSR